MKICPACKNEFEKGNYCKYCGTKLVESITNLSCKQCGARINQDWFFCPECGETVRTRCLVIKRPNQFNMPKMNLGYFSLKELLKKDTNNPEVQREIGRCYARGEIGKPSDDQEAMVWFLKAASAGDAEAMVWLANSYRYGYGCTEDMKASFDWLKKAAQLGYVDAIIRLGSYYILGVGCKSDMEFGQKLYNIGCSMRNQEITWCDNNTVIGGK